MGWQWTLLGFWRETSKWAREREQKWDFQFQITWSLIAYQSQRECEIEVPRDSRRNVFWVLEEEPVSGNDNSIQKGKNKKSSETSGSKPSNICVNLVLVDFRFPHIGSTLFVDFSKEPWTEDIPRRQTTLMSKFCKISTRFYWVTYSTKKNDTFHVITTKIFMEIYGWALITKALNNRSAIGFPPQNVHQSAILQVRKDRRHKGTKKFVAIESSAFRKWFIFRSNPNSVQVYWKYPLESNKNC